MTATTRTSLAIGALAILTVMTVAIAGGHAQNTISGARHVGYAIYRVAFANVHAQDTSGGPGPFMGRERGGRQGPGGFGRFGGPGGRGGPGGPIEVLGMIGRLNLSDAQRDQVKGIVASHRDETKTLADRARPAHQSLQAAVTADTFDEGTIRTRSAEVASVEADMAVARARVHSEILQILTPEQRTQLKELQAQMQQRRQQRSTAPPPR